MRDFKDLNPIILSLAEAIRHCKEKVEEPTLLLSLLILARKEAVNVAWRRAAEMQQPVAKEFAFIDIYALLSES